MKVKELTFDSYSPEEIINIINSRGPVSVITAHAEMIYLSSKDKSYLEPIKKASILVADGVGLVWGLNSLGKGVGKCSGSDIVSTIIEKEKNMPTYLWGASKKNLNKAIKYLKSIGYNIAGCSNGYDYDQDKVLKDIKDSGAKVVLVGMGGTPKQLELVNTIRDDLKISAITVGGVIDVLAGNYVRAPRVFQLMGLEWLWRIILSPKRIIKVPSLIGFVFLIVKERFMG